MKLTGENRTTRRKTCPSATLSTTNPTWTDPGSNPGLRGEKPATNRLSHGTALMTGLSSSSFMTNANSSDKFCDELRTELYGHTSLPSVSALHNLRLLRIILN
jgi:hypothetical protein